jgi:hypothetical protein
MSYPTRMRTSCDCHGSSITMMKNAQRKEKRDLEVYHGLTVMPPRRGQVVETNKHGFDVSWPDQMLGSHLASTLHVIGGAKASTLAVRHGPGWKGL